MFLQRKRFRKLNPYLGSGQKPSPLGDRFPQTDFPWRPGNHGLLTFSIMYAFTENFICPLSHDEVVHGKCSLIGRMPGDWWRQFAGLRTLAFYQMTHPGAKLNFMGNEIGQFIEWRYYESIQIGRAHV